MQEDQKAKMADSNKHKMYRSVRRWVGVFSMEVGMWMVGQLTWEVEYNADVCSQASSSLNFNN